MARRKRKGTKRKASVTITPAKKKTARKAIAAIKRTFKL
jgi:hypothetical protein